MFRAAAAKNIFSAISFDDFFSLLWSYLNVHFNCIVQKTAWSRNAAVLDLLNNVFPVLSVRMVYAIGVHESIENVDVWELCKIANICG